MKPLYCIFVDKKLYSIIDLIMCCDLIWVYCLVFFVIGCALGHVVTFHCCFSEAVLQREMTNRLSNRTST